MGLDMYLNARRYIRSWDDSDTKLQETMNAAFPERGDMEIKTITCEAAYWRKANAIHKWFVDNIQEGRDDCGSYYVNRERLAELRDVCKQVLADRQRAKVLLPAQSGFFFGNTDYDDYYFENIEYTANQLDKLLDPKYAAFDFEYHSSW